MLTQRIIPCLDVCDGRVVKGVKFTDLVDSGDPVELARRYELEGADELVLLDITATVEDRSTLVDLVTRVAEAIRIPFTVGGGVRTVEDSRQLLRAGADKVSFGTVAVVDSDIVRRASEEFGKQAIVISVDAKRLGDRWTVWTYGGRENSGLDVIEFCRRMEELGAGELLVNSLDKDGTGEGFDLDLLRQVTDAVSIPVIASSGVGKLEDFFDAIDIGKVDAVLAAGVFHRKKMSVSGVKEFLTCMGVDVRPVPLRPDFDKMEGLIPAVVQDRMTGAVLMLGFMDEKAYRQTVADGRVWFWSRTRGRLWMKGEESGNILTVVDIKLDCDRDSVLVMVEPSGPTCHTGKRSCFGVERKVDFLAELFDLLKCRGVSGDPTSYTQRLLDAGVAAVCSKVLEESVEVCMAARTESDERVVEESADVIYHLMVLLLSRGLEFEEVVETLKRRRK